MAATRDMTNKYASLRKETSSESERIALRRIERLVVSTLDTLVADDGGFSASMLLQKQ